MNKKYQISIYNEATNNKNIKYIVPIQRVSECYEKVSREAKYEAASVVLVEKVETRW